MSRPPIDCTDLYAPLEALAEGTLFGFDLADYGDLSPVAWMLANKERFVFPLERIAEARKPYNWDDTPDDSGVYFLFLEDQLQYVGRARYISNRLDHHRYPNRPSRVPAEWFDSWSAIWAPDEMAKHVECYYIHKLKPPRNIDYPPIWDIAKEWLRA